MRYMLDTNTIIYAKNNRPEQVLDYLQKHRPEDLCISAVTLAELEYGVCNSSNPAQNKLALLLFLSGIEVLAFDSAAASEYGQIRYQLKKSGTPIGANDMLIAAHAKSIDAVLVTNNLKEFGRIPGLKTENWA